MDKQSYWALCHHVWSLLLQEHIDALPVRVSELCGHLRIPVKRYIPECNEGDGMSTMSEGRPMIFVSSLCGRPRQRFTAAHELGHVLLGHVGKYQLVNREPAPTDNPIEQAANMFAARLLAPACVLWGCGVRSAADIMRLCDISEQSAGYRWERMQELYKRGKFLTHPLERAVYEQFSDYISANKL